MKRIEVKDLVFKHVWCREAGVDPHKPNGPARVFGVAFAASLVAAAMFAFFVGARPAQLTALHADFATELASLR